MTWYAIQVGNDYASDYGSTIKRKAFQMAKKEAHKNPESEVRICVCKTNDDFCDKEIIIQHGNK